MLTSLRALRVASVVLPVIACAVWGQHSWSSQYAQAVERATKNVRIIDAYVLRVVLTQEALLSQADEATRNLSWSEIAASTYVHERLRQIAERSDISSSIGLIDPSGRIRNSARVFPVDANVADRLYFQKLRDGAELYVGDRISSRLSGTDVIAVARRRSGEGFNGIVGMSLRTQALSEFFARLVDDHEAATALYDLDGNLLARHPPLPPTKVSVNAPSMRAISVSREGIFEAEALTDGVRRLYAYARIGDFPLFVTYGIAKGTVFERWAAGMYVAGSMAFAAMLIGWLLTRRAIRRAASEAAYRDQLTKEVAAKTAHLSEALAERDTLLQTKDQLLDQKETLLREVHHRVKNNLQMMSSMVRVVSRAGAADSRAAFDDIARRIATVGRAYDHVHRQDDVSELDLAEYLRGICEQIVESVGRDDIRLDTRLDNVRVDIDTALPVGLITGELVTNACKHAFASDRGGAIIVRLGASDGAVTLVVQDTGVGLAPDRIAKSTGLRITEALAGQIEGQIRYENRPEGGASVRLTLRLRRPS
jgi:two-component sensor histidine kinase